MTFIAMIVTSALIGWFAQAKKGRTGALWGLLTMLLLVPTWVVLYFGTAMTDPSLYKTDSTWWALAILVCGGVGVVMAIIVATLPKRSVQ
jgi:biotin transporter BioY